MRVRRRAAGGAWIAVVAFVVAAGCGSVSNGAINRAAEQVTGCKDVNAANRSVSCKGIGINLEGDGTIPAGFPPGLGLPKNAKIYESSATAGSQGTQDFTVVASLPGDPNDIHDQLKTALTTAGYTISDDSVVAASPGVAGTITATSKLWNVTEVFGQNTTGTDDGGTYVTLEVDGLTAAEANAETTTSGPGGAGATSVPNGIDVGTSLPPGFPTDLALPSSAQIIEAGQTTNGGHTEFEVEAGLDGTVNGVYASYKRQVIAAGYTLSVDSDTTANGSSYATFQGSNQADEVTVVLIPKPDGTSSDKPVLMTLAVTQQ